MRFLTATYIRRFLLLTTLSLVSGCAAFRPIDGVPARYLAPELRAISRSNESTIDLSLLAQKPPQQHHVDGGDILGVYIEGVLGKPGDPPPINVPTTPDLPPSIGYPVSVRDDGTLSLPMIGSVNVRGMTIRQVEDLLRRIYTSDRKILKEGADRIIVSLQRPRQMRILVLRQETGGPGGAQFAQGLSLNLGQTKRGNGQVVHLPIYKNDVLHALARTGGLPGLDAENTIYIVRREYSVSNRFGNTLPSGPPEISMPAMSPSPVESGQGPVQYQRSLQQSQATGIPPSQFSDRKRSGIQLVGYIQTADTEPALSPALAPHSLKGSQNRNRLSPFGDQYSGPCTIEPVVASRFGGQSNNLEELRNGSPSVAVPFQNIPNRASSGNVFQQAGMQHQVPMQRMLQPEISQPPLPTPDPRFNTSPTPVFSQTRLPLNTSPYLQQMPTQVPNNSFLTEPPYDPVTEGNDNPQYPTGDAFCPESDLNFQGMQNDPTMNNRKVIKIPIRLKPGQSPHIRPEDVILQDGDIVFIESRETEIFYTGGLLGGGQYTLPRDYDLDVLGAIAIAQGASRQQASRQIGGVSAMNGDVTISASNVIILRRMPNGAQVPIKVDLYRAITDPSERILIQPGDMVMLRYKMHEAIGAFFERNLLESALFGVAASQMSGNN